MTAGEGWRGQARDADSAQHLKMSGQGLDNSCKRICNLPCYTNSHQCAEMSWKADERERVVRVGGRTYREEREMATEEDTGGRSKAEVRRSMSCSSLAGVTSAFQRSQLSSDALTRLHRPGLSHSNHSRGKTSSDHLLITPHLTTTTTTSTTALHKRAPVALITCVFPQRSFQSVSASLS
jgi:hypothetical protein